MKLKYIVAVENKNLTEKDVFRLLGMDGTEYVDEQLFYGHLHDANAETALEELAKKALMELTKTSEFDVLKTAFDGLCKVCFEAESKIDRFNALLTLYIAVKDWSKDTGLIDTDIQ